MPPRISLTLRTCTPFTPTHAAIASSIGSLLSTATFVRTPGIRATDRMTTTPDATSGTSRAKRLAISSSGSWESATSFPHTCQPPGLYVRSVCPLSCGL
jgi:hypothetical protein